MVAYMNADTVSKSRHPRARVGKPCPMCPITSLCKSVVWERSFLFHMVKEKPVKSDASAHVEINKHAKYMNENLSTHKENLIFLMNICNNRE